MDADYVRGSGEGVHYVAVDLGAESGRVIVGTLRNGRVDLDEVHRFPNRAVRLPDGLHWNVLRLYSEVLVGLGAASRRYGSTLASIGVDSWAVDYALLDGEGRLLGAPFSYRDARTDGVRERLAQRVDLSTLYVRTGIAPLPFNTIYQLGAQVEHGDPILPVARTMLLLPDLLHYWLCGAQAAEYTNATTTGMLGLDGAWAHDLLDRLGLPGRLAPPIIAPGTRLGKLLPAVAAECGLGAVDVVAPATHDTASAVAAVPMVADGLTHAYISSGTWSLLGLELRAPVTTEEARLAGFTNEGGVDGTYRFLTNIMGLWLVQESRRAWAREGLDLGYDELTARAGASPPTGIVIDVDDAALLHPDDMPAALRRQIVWSGQEAPDDPVVLVRAILESLARRYAEALREAERLAGVFVATVHIVGGGSRNGVLCQLAADAVGLPVEAGPVEATALGAVLVQAMSDGRVAGLEEARVMARRDGGIKRYLPGRTLR